MSSLVYQKYFPSHPCVSSSINRRYRMDWKTFASLSIIYTVETFRYGRLARAWLAGHVRRNLPSAAGTCASLLRSAPPTLTRILLFSIENKSTNGASQVRTLRSVRVFGFIASGIRVVFRPDDTVIRIISRSNLLRCKSLRTELFAENDEKNYFHVYRVIT